MKMAKHTHTVGTLGARRSLSIETDDRGEGDVPRAANVSMVSAVVNEMVDNRQAVEVKRQDGGVVIFLPSCNIDKNGNIFEEDKSDDVTPTVAAL